MDRPRSFREASSDAIRALWIAESAGSAVTLWTRRSRWNAGWDGRGDSRPPLLSPNPSRPGGPHARAGWQDAAHAP